MTIGEIVSTNQPVIWRMLCNEYRLKPPEYYRRAGAVKRQIKPMRENFTAIMTERPKPGRAGLLPGEGDDVLA